MGQIERVMCPCCGQRVADIRQSAKEANADLMIKCTRCGKVVEIILERDKIRTEQMAARLRI